MKKALSFAVALGLVAGMASVAVAADNLSLSGDTRWRGVYKNNVDGTDTLSDRTQTMDQRYRLVAKIKASDDVTITSRIVLSDDLFGNKVDGTANALNHYVDRAWMDINTLGGKWSFGRMDASWGNKFFGWGASVDRVKATYKAGDLTFAGYLQKDNEGTSYNAAGQQITALNGDQDGDTWGALVVGKAGDTKWGVIANYITSDTNDTKASGKDTGYLADAFFVTKAGSATILGEIFYSGGDLKENGAGDAIIGGFVGGAVAAGPATVKGLVAYWDGNDTGPGARDCDNDFAPSVLIGTCNETAVINFGATTSGADDSTLLVGVGADMKVNDKVTLGALVGYLQASDTNNVDLIEIDFTMNYALAQNATYTLGVGYGLWDGAALANTAGAVNDDDNMLVVGNRVTVSF